MIAILAILLCVPGSACFPVVSHFPRSASASDTPSCSGRASLRDGMGAATPKCRARTLDLRAHKGSKFPTSEFTDSPRCADLEAKEFQYGEKNQWQNLYDTGKVEVETCYNNIQVMSEAFGDLHAAVGPLFYGDTNMYVEYRQWLKTVLYLNHDPEYFCMVVAQIASTYASKSDTSETLYWKDENRGLAVVMWLYHHGLCDTASERADSISVRRSEAEEWLNDTLVPFNTTDPTLAELGLDTLFNKYFLYASVGMNAPQEILSSAAANPNPTDQGTIISFGISKEAYVKIEVFDILGNRVSSAGFESLFEPGNIAVPISLQGLPSGTYFARIVTAYGEVQTVKLVKE